MTKDKLIKLEDTQVSVKVKLAALWTSFMFLYIYVDYFHLYMPGTLNDMLAGKVFVFEISQVFLFTALVSMSFPISMIFLSVILSAKINRLMQIIVATIYIPYTLFNLAGEAWIHMYWGAAIEVFILIVIIYLSWKWPRN